MDEDIEVDTDGDANETILKVVEEAAPHKANLDTNIAEKIRFVRNEYVALKLKAAPADVVNAYKVKRKNRTQDEKALIKRWEKQTKAEFNALKRFLYPINPMSRPMESLAQKISMIVQMLRYIEVYDFDDALSHAGMRVEVPSLETENEFWANSETKDLAKDIFNQAREIAIEEMNETTAIKEVKYGELPDSLVYSPDNKEGITVSQFVKMVKAKAVGIVKDSAHYTAYKERLIEKDEGALKSAATTLDVVKEM